MAKRKTSGVTTVIAFLLVLVIAGALFVVSKAGSLGLPTFGVRRNGKELYLTNKTGLLFGPEEKFELFNISDSEANVTMKIYAVSGTEETDFTYTYNGESGYSWNAFVNNGEQKNFTSCFDVQVVDNVFSIKHTGFREVVKAYDENMELPEDIPEGDRFVLEIASGGDKITLGFTPFIGVTKVTLSSGEIVF